MEKVTISGSSKNHKLDRKIYVYSIMQPIYMKVNDNSIGMVAGGSDCNMSILDRVMLKFTS